IQIDLGRSLFAPAYDFRQHIEDTLGLKIGMDYTTMSQWSSHTEDGQDFGMSQVLRALGTWRPIRTPGGARGELVWKTETRTSLGGNPTPRDLGFNSGSALSTANFKELRYWGLTDLYWKQLFQDGKYGILVGHMDPGDWADQYSLLNAWTSFMNDAFYNNPTEAIPSRGFGIVGQLYTEKSLYLLAGIHDANGGDGRLDWNSFWDGSEYFTWAEVGLRGESGISARNNTHLHVWHQDAREEAGTEESWGTIFTHSFVTGHDGVAFLRAGYSEGDAPQMRRFVGAGYSTKVFDRDRLGIATSWGSPPDKSRRDQVTSEIFYRLQVTENMTISPDLQLIYQPSFTDETDWLVMPGVRVRIEF
ncbi:MAG: carbohydrate porin, partial [Verrucomicrobiales bacterium]